MRHVVRRSKDHFVRDQVPMFQIVQRSLVFDCEDVAVTVQKVEVEWVNALVGVDEFDNLLLSQYAQGPSITRVRRLLYHSFVDFGSSTLKSPESP